MTELRKRKDNDIGFVDPNAVLKHPNPPPQWKAELEKNLMRFLVNQQNKDILFPTTSSECSIINGDHMDICSIICILAKLSPIYIC